MSQTLPYALDEQFVVLRQIRAGGFGVVYAGWDLDLDRPVALKEIHPELLHQEQALSAFQSEARLVARLDHPGIARVYALRRTRDRRMFMIMEFIEGGDLRSLVNWVRDHGEQLSPQVVTHVIRRVGEALDYAHARVDPTTGDPLHLVHRDIAPSNFMVSRTGSVKLIDFGISRFKGIVRPETMGGVIKGKPQYMSPEQIHSPGEIDRRSDIYSLAVVYLDLLTGKSVYGETTSQYELLNRVRARQFDLPEFFGLNNLPKELMPAISQALELRPKDRTPSAKVFVAQLKPFERAIGYDEERAGKDLRDVAEDAFPAAHLSLDLERFCNQSESAETLDVALPHPEPERKGGPPQMISRPAARTPEPEPTTPPSPPRPPKKAFIWSAWIMGFLALALAGVASYSLFFRPPPIIVDTKRPIETAPSSQNADSAKISDSTSQDWAQSPAASMPAAVDSPAVQAQEPAELPQDQRAAMPDMSARVPRDDGATAKEVRTEQSIKAAKKPVSPPPAQAVLRTIQIRSEPPGAMLSIDGKPQGTTPAPGIQLPDGRYLLTFNLSGYQILETVLVVDTSTPHEVTFALSKLGRRIRISADVAGATVYVDGHPCGFTTMTTDELTPGRHHVMVRKVDVGDDEANVEVVENDVVPQAFKLTGRARGTLSMKGSLDDRFDRTLPQAIIVDGPISGKDKPEDATPRVRRNLPPGRYVIEYRHNGYPSVGDTVWVKPGETAKSSKTLRRR